MPPAPRRYAIRRQLRNYLLDARFQLKFTLYLITMAAVLCALLGAFLWRTTQTLMRETEAAVEARSRAAQTSHQLSAAVLNNELLTRLDDPAFAAQLADKSRAIDAAFEAERAAVLAQRTELVRRQRHTWQALAACLGGFALFVALATIVATHKVAGPLYRMRRLIEQVADGRLPPPPGRLREGDELQDVFEALTGMIRSLRERQLGDARALAAALEVAERAGLPASALAGLRTLEMQMRLRVDEAPAPAAGQGPAAQAPSPSGRGVG